MITVRSIIVAMLASSAVAAPLMAPPALAADAPAGVASASPAGTPESAQGSRWAHTVAAYVWGSGMSGQVAAGNVGADVDVSFSQILENLQAAGMLAYRGTSGRWAVMANVIYMGLGATKDGRLGGSTEADVDQSLLEIDGGYRYAPRWEVYFGARAVHMKVAAEIRPPIGPDLSGDATKSWVDPLVGLRYDVPIGKSWAFVGRGDIGGFGVASRFAWGATARFDWKISKSFGASFGYMALAADYEDGSGPDFFRYDVLTQGPFAAATFSF